MSRGGPLSAGGVVDGALSPDFSLGDAVETFVRREHAERYIEDVRRDDPELATTCGWRSGSSERAG